MQFTGERVVPDQMAVDIDTYIQHLARYVFALRYCVGKTVLDAACGEGYGSALIANVANAVHGIDIDQESIDLANAKYRPSNLALSFATCDLESGTFFAPAGSTFFDTIVSFETIEHLANPDHFLRNVKDRLPVGGKFVFSIPRMSFVRFHKQVYNLQEAQALIKKHFKKCDWYGQILGNIMQLDELSQFFIGIATK